MSLELAITKAGMNTLSTVNLPAAVNSTVVPSSIKMVRAISIPILMRTGQSTISVKAPWLAAANARVRPAVSSVTPSQDTHELTDLEMTFGPADTGVLGAGSVVAVAPFAGLVTVVEAPEFVVAGPVTMPEEP